MRLHRRGFLAVAGCAALVPHAAYARVAGIEGALAATGDARFVAIGERHDNPAHQAGQAALVKALQPAGIAFEMIPHEHEETVNRLRREGASREAIAAALDWAQSGWPDFPRYAAILEAAPEAYIAGGGLSRETLSAVHAEGAPGLGPEMTARYGLDASLSPAVGAAMLDEQYEAHCGLLDRARLAPMVAVQRAWDAAYAEAWRRAGLRGEGRAVLICGNVHARMETGSPAYLARAMPDTIIAAIGQTEEGDGFPPAGFYTATLQAPRPEREDACERMRASMGRSE